MLSMKYEMFVTIEQFINNGGTLETGRELYSGGNYGSLVGTFQSIDDGDVTIRRSYGTFVRSFEYVYVIVECHPIWK